MNNWWCQPFFGAAHTLTRLKVSGFVCLTAAHRIRRSGSRNYSLRFVWRSHSVARQPSPIEFPTCSHLITARYAPQPLWTLKFVTHHSSNAIVYTTLTYTLKSFSRLNYHIGPIPIGRYHAGILTTPTSPSLPKLKRFHITGPPPHGNKSITPCGNSQGFSRVDFQKLLALLIPNNPWTWMAG